QPVGSPASTLAPSSAGAAIRAVRIGPAPWRLGVPRLRKVDGAPRAEGHAQRRAAALGQGARGHGQRVTAQLLHLLFVELHGVEAGEPVERLRGRLEVARPVLRLAEEEAVEIGVDKTGEAAAQQAGGFEGQLKAGDEV